MNDVNMPKLSDTMARPRVREWKKKDGDEVHRGEVLAEIESDKASFEIEAESDGVLHIVVDKGSPVPVGQQIATIGGEAPARKELTPRTEEGATKAEAREPEPGQEPGPDKAERSAEEPAASAEEEPTEQPPAEREAAAEAPARTAEAEEQEPEERPAAAGRERQAQANGVKASPLARRLARESGVDLSTLTGSGPEGRIVKEDVLAAAEESGGGRGAEGPGSRARRRAGQEG